MENRSFRHHQILGFFSFFLLVGVLVFSFIFKSPTIVSNQVQGSSFPTESTTQIPLAAVYEEGPNELSPIPESQLPVDENQKLENEFVNNLNKLLVKINQQDEIDDGLLQELHSGYYSFENPLIVIDPYNVSPLTGLFLFTTSEPINISIHIAGIDDSTDVDFTFDGYNLEHIIPIYGLYPSQINHVSIISTDIKGNSNRNELEIQTSPLPVELTDTIFLIDAPHKELIQPGFNFSHRKGGNAAFDLNGTYRWFLNMPALTFSIINDKQLLYAQGNALEGHVLFIETNPLGRINKVYYAPYGVHHDISEFDGNFLATGSSGETVEDFIYEVDTSNGQISNMLDLKTVLQRSRQSRFSNGIKDWFHNNSIVWKEGNSIIISGRHQSTVAKISWPEGNIDWILASHDGWLPMFEQYLLTPIGNNFEWPYGQHAPEILPDQDNNPNTIDILLFDNGNTRFENDPELQRQIRNNEIPDPEHYSRMVQYRIDETNKTVEQIWQFGKEYGSTLNTVRYGDANLLSNGNRLGCFNVEYDYGKNTIMNGTFFEVTDKSEIVWSAQTVSKKSIDVQSEYRLTRMQIYSQSANNLQIGTPVINLIPQEILDQYGNQQ